jgi:hypothetical protein
LHEFQLETGYLHKENQTRPAVAIVRNVYSPFYVRHDMNDIIAVSITDLIYVVASRVLDQLDGQKYDSALTSQCQLGQLFCKVLQSQKEENWALPIMEAICNDLRRVAITATSNEDVLTRSEENQPTCMERAADVIMALFRVCAADT